MTSYRRSQRVDLGLALVLLVSPDLNGGFTFALVDDVIPSRVIQKNFPDEESAISEGSKLAEEYAVSRVREAFAKLA